MADRPDCPNCGGTGRDLPDGNCGFDDPGALLDIECGRCGGTGRAADRPDRDLADRLDRRAAELDDAAGYWNAECDDLRAAAARLRQLTDRRTQLTGNTSVDIAITYGYEVGVEDGRAEVLAERDEYRRQLDTLRNKVSSIASYPGTLTLAPGDAGMAHCARVMAGDLIDALAAVGDPEEGRDE